jgi:hypothetical protein
MFLFLTPQLQKFKEKKEKHDVCVNAATTMLDQSLNAVVDLGHFLS